MADKKFLMLSLEDEKSKKIANIVGNESCRKILDRLSEKESTESELAKSLGLPISTIHYNLQQLVAAGLVSADEYHYSKKGKEIRHYKLANKYIIITPRAVSGIKSKLSKILPVALIAGGAGVIVQLIYQYFLPGQQPVQEEASMAMMRAAPETAVDSAGQAAMMAQSAPPDAISLATPFPFEIGLLFFVGALFGAIVYIILASLEKRE